MATRKRSTGPTRGVLRTGPWRRVYAASDVPGAAADSLYGAHNMCKMAGSFAMRPPFTTVQAGGTLGAVGGRYGQCLYELVASDGTIYRFVFCGGKVYRWDGATTFTDVTPGGVTISTTARIYCTALNDKLIVTDGTNRPWIGTSLGATPITGTYIDLDGAGTAWTAYGQPVIYSAKVVFIGAAVGGAGKRTTIYWSEENDPATGYVQSSLPYNNAWQITQTGTTPLYALAATNDGLFFFRELSIGAILGKIGPDFQTASTLDSVSTSVGTTTPASVVVAGDAVWFLDHLGRPCRLPIGASEPEPLWQQMQDIAYQRVQVSNLASSITTTAFAVYVPDLNEVVMAAWKSPSYTLSPAAADALYVFDAASGTYLGTRGINTNTPYAGWDAPFHTMAVLHTSTGISSLCVLGDTTQAGAIATSGTMWRMRSLAEMDQSTVLYQDPGGPIFATVVSHPLGMDQWRHWTIDMFSARFVDPKDPIDTVYAYRTASTSTASVSNGIGVTVPAGPPIQMTSAGAAAQANFSHVRAVAGMGPDCQGRWIQPNISIFAAASLKQPFRPLEIVLEGTSGPLSPLEG